MARDFQHTKRMLDGHYTRLTNLLPALERDLGLLNVALSDFEFGQLGGTAQRVAEVTQRGLEDRRTAGHFEPASH